MRPNPRLHLAAAQEARIEHIHRLQPLQRIGVKIEMFRLPAHRPFPIETEPGEVAVDRLLEFGSRARRIDVFHAQQEKAAAGRSEVVVEDCRKRVTEMKETIWARGKTKDTIF